MGGGGGAEAKEGEKGFKAEGTHGEVKLSAHVMAGLYYGISPGYTVQENED